MMDILNNVEKLYKEICRLEELARDRVLDTPTNSPCYTRYMTQLNERTAFKHLIYDMCLGVENDNESNIP